MRELSLNILDIATNSVEAEAGRIIIVIEELNSQNLLRIRIKDNGRGMEKDFVKKVLDPFVTTRSTRSVGMGLSMFRQLAQQCSGGLLIQSALNVGTLVTATFELNNLDRPPLGDVADSIVNLAIGAIDVHFAYLHRTDFGNMCFDSFSLLNRMADTGETFYLQAPQAKRNIRAKLHAIQSEQF